MIEVVCFAVMLHRSNNLQRHYLKPKWGFDLCIEIPINSHQHHTSPRNHTQSPSEFLNVRLVDPSTTKVMNV